MVVRQFEEIPALPPQANAMAPALDTVGEAGVRADIVIPKLRPRASQGWTKVVQS